MKLLRPVVVDDAKLTSSDVVDEALPAWSAATNYAVGARVIRATTHRIYENLIAGTDAGLPEATPTRWLEVGATNKWRMFDAAAGSFSTRTGSMTIVLAPGKIDALALLGLTAKRATVSMSVGGVAIYSRTLTTAVGGTSIDNWFSWFFEPIGTRTTFLFDDIPPYSNGVVTVLIEGATSGATVACGTLLVGRKFDIGLTLGGVDLGIDDFSKKDRDDFGVVTFVPRAYSDSAKVRAAVSSSRMSAIRSAIAAVRATPTLWIVDPTTDAGLIYGLCSGFRGDLQSLTGTSYVTLDLESLV